MDKRLSILHSDEDGIDLQTNKSDVLAALARGVIGAAPFVGPMIVETVTSLIPDQKLERLITWAGIFEAKFDLLSKDFIQHKLQTEEGSDLLEDAMNQATRAISHERKEYIASLLKNGLTLDDLNHLEKKKLLSILGELNNAEILYLKFHSLTTQRKQEEFYNKHTELFVPIALVLGASQHEIDKTAVRDTYERKLVELGLVRPNFKRANRGETPEFDEKTGMVKSSGYSITSLGKLLLRYIDSTE